MNKSLSFFLFIFLVSCAHFAQKKSRFLQFDERYENQWTSYLARNCYSAEGVGRILINDEAFQFTYESMLNSEKEQFVIGLAYPLIGQEIINWDFRNKKTSGSFYQRLHRAFDPELQVHVEQTNRAIIEYFSNVKNFQKNLKTCQIEEWNKESHKMQLTCPHRISWMADGDEITYIKRLNSRSRLEIKLGGLEKKFMTTKISIIAKSFLREKNFFEMDLRAESCD
ncbi:MAG: hypothetical protein JNM93_12650 [Bacteriovoracaceae bacterium]|nr:hypothetical protein [Bacteriovoracaceae bacterium]